MIQCGVMVSGVKMWELGVRGKMWRVIKEMYRVSRVQYYLMGNVPRYLMCSKV